MGRHLSARETFWTTPSGETSTLYIFSACSLIFNKRLWRKVIGIFGSPRQMGNSDILLNSAIRGIKQNMLILKGLLSEI